jgi:zinc protease
VIFLHRLAAAIAFVACLGFTAAFAQDFKAETFTLQNGLQVVVLPDHRVPVVTHQMWYRIGSADEAKGKSGIAHFLEHLMFKGTNKIPPGEFSKIIARNGGSDNAQTSTDYTMYFERVAKDRLPLIMEMEADRIKNLVLTDEIVLPERAVILEERSQRIDNDPSSLLFEQMSATLYLSHSYGIPVIGWRHEMEQLTRQDAIDFYQKHYAPDNAILVVAGDITAAELKPLVDQYYAPLAASGVHRGPRPKEPPPIAPRRVQLEDARVEQPSISRLYLSPSYTTATEKMAYAIEVMTEILGGSDTSRLSKILVEDKKIAVSASTYYDGDGVDDTYLFVSATPREGIALDALEAEMDKIIQDFIAGSVTPEELARAKTVLKAAAVYARDSQSQMATIYGSALVCGETIEDVEQWPARIEAVTAEEVKAAAAFVLQLNRSVTGWLRPKTEGQPQ